MVERWAPTPCGGPTGRSPGRPQEAHEDMTLAVREIVLIGDSLIEHRRADAGTPTFEDAFACADRLVSNAIGVQFPMTGLHWKRVEKSRGGMPAPPVGP